MKSSRGSEARSRRNYNHTSQPRSGKVDLGAIANNAIVGWDRLGVPVMKNSVSKRFTSAVTLLALMGSATAFAQQTNKPNVVFILSDNVGYGDLGDIWRGCIARGSDATS